jgi:hypothetical protein
MEPGAYVEPLVRTTWVQVPMVSGYVGSRLRVADYSFGTNFTGASLEDNKVHLTIENVSDGTFVYFQVQQTNDDGPSGTRATITPQYAICPNGKRVVDFFPNAQFIEIKCVGGAGEIRAQVDSRLKWEQMAMDRRDPFGCPQLWDKKFTPGPGVVAPVPFTP